MTRKKLIVFLFTVMFHTISFSGEIREYESYKYVEQHLPDNNIVLSVEEIVIGNERIVYVVSRSSETNRVTYQHIHKETNRLLVSEEINALRQKDIARRSKQVELGQELEEELSKREMDTDFDVVIMLRSREDFNKPIRGSETNDLGSVEIQIDERGNVNEINKFGDTDSDKRAERFLRKKRLSRELVINQINDRRWNFDSTANKLIDARVKSSFLDSGYARITLAKKEIEDVLKNGEMIFTSIDIEQKKIDKHTVDSLQNINVYPYVIQNPISAGGNVAIHQGEEGCISNGDPFVPIYHKYGGSFDSHSYFVAQTLRLASPLAYIVCESPSFGLPMASSRIPIDLSIAKPVTRIYNGSWGVTTSVSSPVYTQTDEAFDNFGYFNNVLSVFSAGNKGDDPVINRSNQRVAPLFTE